MNTASKLIVAVAVVATPIVVLRVAKPEQRPAMRTAPTDSAAACVLAAGPHPLPAVLVESSGIARARDGSLWSHNDGDEARLYRVDASGTIAQVVQLEGAGASDIEDIDAGPCPDGAGECIWLADTGDNDGERAAVALLVLPLPDTAARVARATRIGFTYPEGPRDAEALAVLSDREAIVVTKGRDTPIEAYRITVAGWRATVTGPLARIADAPRESRDRITGGGTSEDGRWIALRSNDRLTLHPAARLLAGDATPALSQDLRPLREAQGEGVDLTSDGTVWLTSEGERGTPTLARLRCPLGSS